MSEITNQSKILTVRKKCNLKILFRKRGEKTSSDLLVSSRGDACLHTYYTPRSSLWYKNEGLLSTDIEPVDEDDDEVKRIGTSGDGEIFLKLRL